MGSWHISTFIAIDGTHQELIVYNDGISTEVEMSE
jgi:hypothetical protein